MTTISQHRLAPHLKKFECRIWHESELEMRVCELGAENKQLKEDLVSALMKVSDRDFRIKMLKKKNRGLSILCGYPEE